MIDVGTFGVPGNFATPFYTPTTGSYDMPGLRKYLRGQLPPDRYSFTDEQLDKLISGEGLPGPISMYDLQAGQGGPMGTSAPGQAAGKVVGSGLSAEELARTAPVEGDGTAADVEVAEPPPPEPLIVDSDEVLGKTRRDRSQAYYDPDTGDIRGTFFGSYGTRIDPDTGTIVPGTEPYTTPLFDPGAVYAPRTGPEGQDLGSYQDLFPIYLYGSAPSNALVELDRYGLGLDFVRANPTSLQQWWTDVFKPVYMRFASTAGGYTEDERSLDYSWYNPGNWLGYWANPLSLLLGPGGQAGPAGEAAISAARDMMGGVDPMSLQLDLPLTPDSLMGQIFGGSGLTIAPGAADALLRGLGDIVVDADQFDVGDNRQAIIDRLRGLVGDVEFGPESFSPENVDATINRLRDLVGDVTIGPDQFKLGEGYSESTGPFSVEDKLLGDLGIIEVGPGQFTVDDPGSVVTKLRSLVPSISIGPEAFAPANIPGTVDRLRDLIPDVTIDPSQFTPAEIDATVSKLIADLGTIEVGPEQFALGTDYTAATGPRTVTQKLLDDVGVVEVAPDQFAIEDVGKSVNKLLADLGYVEVGPGQFQLGTGESGQTPEQKLLQDLEIIKVGPDGFELDDTAEIKLSLLNDLGMIKVGVAGSGVPGFTLDPAAAGILRDELVTAINPLTAADFERDPSAIAAEIRKDIVGRIDAINRGDIGLTDEDINRLLDPLRSEFEALPGEVEEAAISPIENLLRTLEMEGRALPARFAQDVESPIADMIEGLRTSLTQDIGGFQVPDTFLEKGTRKAESLLDLIYGTGPEAEGRAAGIQGFNIPPVFDQLEGRLGSFDAPETLMGKVRSLQDALRGIDLDALTAPAGLDALVADIGKLSADLPGAELGLGAFQTALGAFSSEDQAIMGMLLNLIGPEGIASLGTEQLADLITRFKEMQGTALTDAMGAFYASDDDVQPWLDALRKGVMQTYGPIPEMEWEGLIPGLLQGISDEYEPTFKRAAGNIEEIREILENLGEGDMAGTGTGAGAGVAGASGSGWLKTLQDALTPKIAGAIDPATGTRAALPDLTAEYLTGEPVTASLLADLEAKQGTQDQELLEQLQRYGVITSGASAEAIPELDSLQRRERLGVLGSAAERIQAERDAAMQRGLDLSKTLTTRDLGMAELTGLAGDTQTLGGREADLDIISAVIAALDPSLDIKGNKEELAVLLLELLGDVPGGEDADWISRFKTMVMGD